MRTDIDDLDAIDTMLRKVVACELPITAKYPGDWEMGADFDFEIGDGWEVSIFVDGMGPRAGYDYTNYVKFPDGRKFEFEDFNYTDENNEYHYNDPINRLHCEDEELYDKLIELFKGALKNVNR